MQVNQSGSVLLLVIILTSVLISCCLSMWQAVVYSQELVHQRIIYTSYFRATEALAKLGIICYKNYIRNYKDTNTLNSSISLDTLSIEVGPFQVQKNYYSGMISYKKRSDDILVLATLLEQKKMVMRITYSIEEQEQEKLLVGNWSVDVL